MLSARINLDQVSNHTEIDINETKFKEAVIKPVINAQVAKVDNSDQEIDEALESPKMISWQCSPDLPSYSKQSTIGRNYWQDSEI